MQDADDTAAAYDVWFDETIGLKQVLENMGRSQVSTYFTWASDTHMAVTYYKLSIVFFRSGVFGAVPARTVARKHSKYKAFLYIGL